MIPVTNKNSNLLAAFYLEIIYCIFKELGTDDLYVVQNDLMLILAQTFSNKKYFSNFYEKYYKSTHPLNPTAVTIHCHYTATHAAFGW